MNMVKRFVAISISISFAALLVFGFSASTDTQTKQKNEALLRVIMQDLAAEHFEPMAMSDDFSERVFKLYIDNLDPSKRFLISTDIERLAQYQKKLDNQIKDLDYSFFDLSVKMIQERVEEAKSYYQTILAVPFDFVKEEFIELDAKKTNFCATKEELKKRWEESLKYQTMLRLTDLLEEQEKAEEKGNSKVAHKSFTELEAEARQKVLKTQDTWFSRMTKLTNDDRMSVYLNSITSSYDPHSNYFPPKDKQDFDISLSGRLEGIGATLQEKDGYIKVVSIVPGSPSARQGELQVDDLILKVGQGTEEPVDVVDMRLDEAVQLIRGKKGTEVRLTVKKVDGTTKIIPIVRDIVMIEEGYAKSAIIQDEQLSTNTGYIHLPKFYADFNHTDGRNCATDVLKEVNKLKAEGVNGIIIDLRDNGGGSLRDVVDMSGFFIKEGPIVQVKSRDEAPYVYQDRDAKSHYDGPLVILVNQFSASASEIMAAALQDYGRAVIVGSPATYGKGTVQRFTNLDALVADNDLRPLGSLKLTIQKFYRINGKTTQLNGVVPDIILPDKYAYIDVGEKEQDYPMPFDQIESANYRHWNSSNMIDIEKIKLKSLDRVSNNPVFQLVEENAQYLKNQRDVSKETLCLDKYRSKQKDSKSKAKKFEAINDVIAELNVQTLQTDIEDVKTDTVSQNQKKDFTTKLQKDPYVLEAVYIINDLNTR